MVSHPEFNALTEASTVAAAFASSIKDKVILITGVANGGIGGATAKAFAAHSPRLLILAGRSPDRVNAVISEIAHAFPRTICHFLSLDLSSQSSVRAAAAKVLQYSTPLHLLINNAAVMSLPTRSVTSEGLETQFATNHIGPFLFTNLLLPKLLAAVPNSAPNSVRIISLSSSAHSISPIRFSDLDFSHHNDSLPPEEQYLTSVLSNLGLLEYDHHYVPTAAYAQSKTANILFTNALNARLARKGVLSFAVHPGSVASELQRHGDQEVLAQARKKAGTNVIRKTLDQGASTTLVAALDPELSIGEGSTAYLADCAFKEPAEWCRDEKGKEGMERLWRVSEGLVGEEFRWD